MPSRLCGTVTLALLSFGLGCGSPATTANAPAVKVSSGSRFVNRLEAALAISLLDQRDAALTKLAKEAAEAGDEKVVAEAVKNIHFLDQRDSTAATCARALQKAGKEAAAVALAKTISVIDLRDQVLSGLAEGKK